MKACLIMLSIELFFVLGNQNKREPLINSKTFHCSFNRVIRHRTFVPGAIFADFSMARQAGLRVTGYGSTNATSRIACSLLEPSHTRTASPSGEVFSRRFLAPAMRLMSQRRGKPFRFMTCKETMSWLVVIRT